MIITIINVLLGFFASIILLLPYLIQIDIVNYVSGELTLVLMVLILLGALYGTFIVPFKVKSIHPFVTGFLRLIGSVIYLFSGFFIFLKDYIDLTAGLLLLAGSIGAVSGIYRGVKARAKGKKI